MAKLAINKSSLKHQRDQLTLFQRFLPSLDLKRQQLLTEQKTAQKLLAEAEQNVDQLTRSGVVWISPPQPVMTYWVPSQATSMKPCEPATAVQVTPSGLDQTTPISCAATKPSAPQAQPLK